MNSPEQVLRQWMQGVNDGNVALLMALYDPQAVLIPTFSNRLLGKPETIRDYFERLSTREELSIALHEKTLGVTPLGNQLFAMQGIYCWRFAIDGELLSFEARFSFVVDMAREAPILQHHSSQIPRTL